MRLLRNFTTISINLPHVEKDNFMSVEDGHFLLFCSHNIVRFNHLKKNYSGSCVYFFLQYSVILQTREKKKSDNKKRKEHKENLTCKWWRKSKTRTCKNYLFFSYQPKLHIVVYVKLLRNP